VTHDIPMAQKYTQHYLMMTPGKVEQGPIANLTTEKVWEGENV